MVAIPKAAAAEGACAETPVGRARRVEGGILITEPHADALHAGDVVVQINSRVLTTCEDLSAAIDLADRERLSLLFLVRRGEALVPVVAKLREETIEPSESAQPVPTPPLANMDGPSASELRLAVADLAQFGRSLRASLPVPASRSLVARVRDMTSKYEGKIAAAPGLVALRPILEYYNTVAEILVLQQEVSTHEGKNIRQLNPLLEYQSNSRAAQWFERYPFLRSSIRNVPEKLTFLGSGERAGYWSPGEAVQLLVDRAVADADALSARLASAPSY